MHANTTARIGILGGSFNPVHHGHLRLAVEARELLALDRVELVPTTIPPHKPRGGLLPFGLRCRLLRLAAADDPGLAVSLIEGRRRDPCYTWDTLSASRRAEPGARLFFLMGVSDLPALPDWHRGLELPRLADLTVAARQGMSLARVASLVRLFWPGSAGPKTLSTGPGGVQQWDLPEGGRLILLNPPLLEISSTLVRTYWRQDRSLRFLLPEAVESELRRRKHLVRRYWNQG